MYPPMSDRELVIHQLQLWGEVPRRRGTIEDFWALDDEDEDQDDWFTVVREEEENE